jgi:hypothetical protein
MMAGIMMKLKADRIISIATLIASLVAIVLVLKRPAPVARPQTPAAIAANAQSFGQKMEEFDRETTASSARTVSDGNSLNAGDPVNSPSISQNDPISPANNSMSAPTQSKAEVHLNSDEISAVLAQAAGAASSELTPNTNLGSGQPNIKDQQVSFEGDTVHGQFLTEIAGKDVWVTVSGHLSSKEGYATFEPTEFKVGDLDIPVSLVNPALQKKMMEQRDRMKLPENVGGLKVQNGELVLQEK